MSWPFKSQGFLRNQESYSLTKTHARFWAEQRQQAAAVHGASPKITWNTPTRRSKTACESACYQLLTEADQRPTAPSSTALETPAASVLRCLSLAYSAREVLP